jgi:transketolase C-terminal domain/subunit
MCDNTCHFGLNSLFADNGLSDVESRLYFPADALQMVAVIDRVFFDHGLRFVFSTRSKVPYILKEDGVTKFYGEGYKFVPGKDEIIVEGKAGYVVSFGELLYRSYDAVLRCRQEGLDVGLINKPTLNIVDEEVIPLCSTFSHPIHNFVFEGYPKDWQDAVCSRGGISQSKDRRMVFHLYIEC